jgi:hypothetical protein
MAKSKLDSSIEGYQNLNKSLQEQRDLLISSDKLHDANRIALDQISDRQRMINQLISAGVDKDSEKGKLLADLIKLQEKEIAQQKKINDQLDKERKTREEIVGLAKSW